MRIWLIVATLALTACDLSGRQTYPGASVFEAPDGGFHFHYLSPPWRSVPAGSEYLINLVVDQVGALNTTTYKLFVGYYSGPSLTAQQAALELQTTAKGASQPWTITREVASISSRTGEEGWEYHGYRDIAGADRFYQREIVFNDASGRRVLFLISTVYPTTEADIDDLILSYSAGPDDGTETPARKVDAGGEMLDAGADILGGDAP